MHRRTRRRILINAVRAPHTARRRGTRLRRRTRRRKTHTRGTNMTMNTRHHGRALTLGRTLRFGSSSNRELRLLLKRIRHTNHLIMRHTMINRRLLIRMMNHSTTLTTLPRLRASNATHTRTLRDINRTLAMRKQTRRSNSAGTIPQHTLRRLTTTTSLNHRTKTAHNGQLRRTRQLTLESAH